MRIQEHEARIWLHLKKYVIFHEVPVQHGKYYCMVTQTFKISDRMKELGGLFGLFRCQVVHIELHQIGSQFIFVFVDQIFLFLNFVELII